MPDLDARLSAARLAVTDAALVCRSVQADLASVRAELKDDRSPVTVADWASQAVVVRRLYRELGEQTIVGEEDAEALRQPEQGALREHVLRAVRLVWPEAGMDEVLDAIDVAGSGARPRAEGFWTLDPIDGTKGFLRGEQYAVSLGWIEGSRPRVGALGCPNLSSDFERPFDAPDQHGIVFWAAAERGVRQAPADRPGASAESLQVEERPADDPPRVCQSVEKAHSNTGGTARLMEHLGIDRHAALDSQAKYAVVARRQADAYLRLPTRRGYSERIWDHAAGSLVASEAGCVVSDVRGRGLDFGQGRGLDANLGVICASERLHPALLEAAALLGLDREPPEA
ncbi:MAG: 3'(2'),5'-bisphosphate nucleotidase [Proteobacteria bacterium]|nr:3'(2'),5'-bisphosphate nucleotidase [Pseudomonadota bacterium]